ncbi:transglycosylase SLT domain-containing protein [Rickettsiales bacterium LUAb2]
MNKKIFIITVACIFSLVANVKAEQLYNIKYTLPNSVITKTYADLPKVLSDNDLQLYYRIFTLQKQKSNFKEADKLINQLNDKSLLGYVYYDRYESKSYVASSAELKSWMNKYYDLPVASDIYNLLKRKVRNKRSLNVRMPLQLGSITPIYFNEEILDSNSKYDSSAASKHTISRIVPKSNYITKRLNLYLRRGKSLLVKNLLSQKDTIKKLDGKTYAYYANMLAYNYFINGRDDYSIEWAKKAIKSYKAYLPEANITLGLVYWRQQDYETARSYFSYVVDNKDLYSTDIVSKAAYWSARCSLRLQEYKQYYQYLKVASNYYYNFYGILASEEVGITPNYNWDVVNLSRASVNSLLDNSHGRRALALLQFGLVDWAEQELNLLAKYDLNSIKSKDSLDISKAMTYLAQSVPMPMLGVNLAGVQGVYYGLGHMAYPIINIDSYSNDANVDPLLVMAVIRRESSFNSRAKSSVGAIGLMQLMPSTAKMLVQNISYNSDYTIKSMLMNPNFNVNLGQKYLKMLLNSSNANNNLIYSLAGWNGGLLNVAKWRKEKFRHQEDPLFFIESIPFFETKNFVTRVINDYWIYQITIGVKPVTAMDIINIQNPIYQDPSDQYMQDIGNFNYNVETNSNIINVTYGGVKSPNTDTSVDVVNVNNTEEDKGNSTTTVSKKTSIVLSNLEKSNS